MKRITDKDFVYTPAAATDIRRTFARVRRELKQREQQAPVKAIPLRRTKP